NNPPHNPGLPWNWNYYYLYALERVGMLYGTPSIGTHDWYAEGSRKLLELQQSDGSWWDRVDGNKHQGGASRDTCFALLFLKRATRPPEDVASVDRYLKAENK